MDRKLAMTWLKKNLHELLFYGDANAGEVGRGAVLVDTAQVQDRSFEEIQAAGEVHYMLESLLPPDDPDTRRLVQEYNPQSEIVVVFHDPARDAIDGFRVSRNREAGT